MTKNNKKTNKQKNQYSDELTKIAFAAVYLQNSAAKIYSNDRKFEETDTTYRNHMLTEAFKLRIQIDDLPIEKQKSDIIQGASFTLQLLIDRYGSFV